MIAVCITTHNRYDVFKESYENIKSMLPANAILIVVDDGSTIPVPEATYRFEHNVGIARAKNKCIELAMDSGAEHIFCLDDDVRVLSKDVWDKYISHPEPHLCFAFKLPNKPINDMQIVHQDESTISYSHTRGAFLYYDRKCIEVVGGFDTSYKTYGFEHVDMTNRIHNVGLTANRSQDIPNSKEYLYCLDQDSKVESSIPDKDRQASMRKNYLYYRANRGSKAYKEYKNA